MMSPDLVAARAEWLRQTFYDDTEAPRAEKTFRRLAGKKENPLRHLLRNHVVESIEDGTEIRRRDEFDQLLAYYAVREFAIITGYLPPDARDDSLSLAREILESVEVRPFYERHYPLLLPRLFRERLAGRWTFHRENVARRDGLVEEFLTLNKSAEGDAALQRFLWFLDDGWAGNRSMADVIEEVLESPELLIKVMTQSRRVQTDEAAVLGFGHFLRICLQHDAMLSEVEDPLVRAALWHVNEYWYSHLDDKLKPVVRQAQRAVDARTPSNGRHADGVDNGAAPVNFAQVVARLTSSQFGAPLEEAARAALS